MDKIYNSAAHEKAVQSFWEEVKPYNFEDNGDPVYSIDTPPPTVSGTLHIGHVFSYTQTDLVARYKRMRGFNVFYPMGFDDNGLPTERFVEKKNQTKAHLMLRSEFITLCMDETHAVERVFENLWRSLGLSVDWSRVYSTISDKARRVSQYSFIQLYEKGVAFRQAEPSLYCTTCRTSVAQAELDGAQLPSTFNDITFQATTGEQLLVATTRPELLPACVALFYHPDDSRYQHLSSASAISPFFNKKVPVLADEAVDPEKGTGLVMCCTFGDQTDIHWYKKHNLDFVALVGLDGKWTNHGGPLAGMTAHEARKKMIELLESVGALKDQKKITHHVNIHERCKQEIEFIVLWQWFINILDYKEEFLALADRINWKPAYMKVRYKDWVTNLSWNWCISRQRFFGIPFPAWHCQSCGEILLADKSMLPIDPQETKYPGGACTACGSEKIVADTDVMDTWNTSSLTPQINLGWPDELVEGLSFPMDMRPQAHDIIRTWAFDTIVKSYFHHNDIPWKDIVISGHVLAGKEKISKSQENSKMSPEALLATYPADVIRYWTAQATLGVDTVFSETQLKIGQRLVTKLWNAFRFCEEHLNDYNPADDAPTLDHMNGWVMHHFSHVVKEYIQAFDDYDYCTALAKLERFFWHIWCDNYIEMIKDQLFNPDNYTPAQRAATAFVLHEVGFGLLQLFAPYLPFITETIYQQRYKLSEKSESLHKTIIDESRFDYEHAVAHQLGDMMLDIIGAVRKMKSERQISLKAAINTLIIYVDAESSLLLQQEEALLKGVTHAETIEYYDEDHATELTYEDLILVAHVRVVRS